MKTFKFLEEVRVLEDKLRQEADDKNRKLNFPGLVQHLIDSDQLDEQRANDLKEIWDFRNQIYSSPTLIEEVPNEIQNRLANLISIF